MGGRMHRPPGYASGDYERPVTPAESFYERFAETERQKKERLEIERQDQTRRDAEKAAQHEEDLGGLVAYEKDHHQPLSKEARERLQAHSESTGRLSAADQNARQKQAAETVERERVTALNRPHAHQFAAQMRAGIDESLPHWMGALREARGSGKVDAQNLKPTLDAALHAVARVVEPRVAEDKQLAARVHAVCVSALSHAAVVEDIEWALTSLPRRVEALLVDVGWEQSKTLSLTPPSPEALAQEVEQAVRQSLHEQANQYAEQKAAKASPGPKLDDAFVALKPRLLKLLRELGVEHPGQALAAAQERILDDRGVIRPAVLAGNERARNELKGLMHNPGVGWHNFRGSTIEGLSLLLRQDVEVHAHAKIGVAPQGQIADDREKVGAHRQDRSTEAKLQTAQREAATPTAQWAHYLGGLHRFLHDQTNAEREALVDLRANREEHPIVGAAAEAIASVKARFHSVKIPDLFIWDQVSAHVAKAHSLLSDEANLDAVKQELATATKLFYDAHRQVYEYRTAVDGGGETAITILRGIEIGCDITLAVLSAGVGAEGVNVAKLGARGVFRLAAEQAAKDGLGKTALKAAAVGGANKLAQGTAEYGTAGAVGAAAEFDVEKVLSEAGEAAVMNFLCVLVGGKLSQLFLRSLGEVIGSRLPPEALLKLVDKYGVVGKLPPELFVSKGWRFFVGAVSDACTTTLLTGLTVVVSTLRGGEKKPSAEQFTMMVVEQMVRNGLLQVVVGSLMHTSIDAKRRAAIDFYKRAGWHEDRISGHLTGIDFTKLVEVVTLKKGTLMAQWQSPGAPQGTYYSHTNYTPVELGIGSKGTNRATSEVLDKSMILYDVVYDVEVLNSRCSAPDDSWSVTGMVQYTKGGGEQFFSADQAAFRAVNKSD